MSSIGNKAVKVNPDTIDIIKNELQEIYQRNLNSPIKRFLISKGWIIFNFLLFFITFGIFASGVFVLVISEGENKFGIVLLVSGILCFIFSFLTMMITSKIKSVIISDINIEKIINCYNCAAISNFKDLTIRNIAKKFTIMPQKFVPVKTMDNKIYIENVIDGMYNQQQFNFGTMLEETVEKDADGKEETTYDRYLYLTIEIKFYDYITTIQPETLFDRMAHKQKIKLESQEFEKLFAVEYNEPIKLRKLFQPKVMENMVEFSKVKPIPYIYLNQEQVTIMLSDDNNSNASVFQFDISNKLNNTLKNITNTIEKDLTTLQELVNWVKILQLI